MRRLLPFAAAALLAACGSPSSNAPDASTASVATAASTSIAPAPAASTSVASNHDYSPAITGDDLAADVRVLSSDAFGGRGPGSEGARKTIHFLIDHFKHLGLTPGNHGKWLQQVSVRSTTLTNTDTTLKLSVNGKKLTFDYGDDMIVTTLAGKKHVSLDDSDVVFIGYGVDAPEHDWNDFRNIDVKGKTVIVLVNDPGFSTHDPDLFKGRAMTYYGRWTYKYEEAARQGAAACFIVHQTEAAGYPWSVVRNSWSGPQFALADAGKNAPRLAVAGWLSNAAARKLFAAAGKDFDKLRKAASKRGFEPVNLHAKASIDLKSKIGHFTSNNVLAMIPGSTYPDEAVIYTAHWDHLGTDPSLKGDQIYNGAADNATGVAGLLEIAAAFMHQKQPPKRSVLFAAVTLEESGLLGSEYYVKHPVFALDKTVADINMDMLQPIGKAKDITVVGLGQSQLDGYLKKVVAKQGRTLSPVAHPEKGFYFRSDHFSFAKAGVPALYIETGEDLINGGTKAGHKAAADFVKNRYHTVNDEYDAKIWKMGGIVEDVQALYQVGRALAAGHDFPQWSKDSAFRAARQKMMKQSD